MLYQYKLLDFLSLGTYAKQNFRGSKVPGLLVEINDFAA
jgi:hypothetical protein